MVAVFPGEGKKTSPEIWDPLEKEMPAKEMACRIKTTLSYNAWYHAAKELSLKGLPFEELRIAELWCGTGTVSLTFGLLGASVRLIDSNDRVLERAKRIYDRFKCPAEFIRADCLESPPEAIKGVFDLSLSSGLAEHFSGIYRQRCMDYHRLLVKPGGMVMIGVPNGISPFYQRVRCFRILTGTWGLDVEVPYTNWELRALAQRVGLRKCYVLGASPLFRDLGVYSRGFVSAMVDLFPRVLRDALRRWKTSGEGKMHIPSDPVSYSVGMCRASLAVVESKPNPGPTGPIENWLSSGLTLVAYR